MLRATTEWPTKIHWIIHITRSTSEKEPAKTPGNMYRKSREVWTCGSYYANVRVPVCLSVVFVYNYVRWHISKTACSNFSKFSARAIGVTCCQIWSVYDYHNKDMKGNAECKKFRFEPPFGGHRGNAHGSSVAWWKAHCRLPISDNWTFSLAHTAEKAKSVEISVFWRVCHRAQSLGMGTSYAIHLWAVR